MGNRKLPFGYQMRMGEIIRNEPEAKAVQDIFLQYTLGASLKEIAAQMNKTGPTYDEGKSWNKNMVARILENAKYTGADDYPKLVDTALFEAASTKRQTQQRMPERTPAQKALKRVCSKPPTPEIEQQVTRLLGRLAEQPERITQPERTSVPVHTNTQAELDDVLNTQPRRGCCQKPDLQAGTGAVRCHRQRRIRNRAPAAAVRSVRVYSKAQCGTAAKHGFRRAGDATGGALAAQEWANHWKG